jgi:hypothetical protein
MLSVQRVIGGVLRRPRRQGRRDHSPVDQTAVAATERECVVGLSDDCEHMESPFGCVQNETQNVPDFVPGLSVISCANCGVSAGQLAGKWLMSDENG